MLKQLMTIEEWKKLSEDELKIYKDLYKEVDGKYELQMKGMVSKVKLDEFRTNNLTLIGEKEALEAQMVGVDLEEYKTLKAEAEKLKEKGILDDEGIEALFKERVSQMTRDHGNQTDTLTVDRDKWKSKFETSQEHLSAQLIDSKITNAIMDGGLGNFKSEHLTDVLSRGRTVWKLNEAGEAIPYDSNGGVRFGVDGKTPMTFPEWASEVNQTVPGFWESSSGGGAEGGKGKPASNLSELAAMKNPKERLAAIREMESQV